MNKLVFKTKELLNGVKIGGDYAGNNKVLPILGCVKIVIKEDSCNIISYDEKNAISYKCPIESFDGEVTFCIGKKDIENYLSTLSEETIILEVDIKKLQCKIITSKGHIVLPIEDDNCYPSLARGESTMSFEMDASMLSYWISKASNFIETDEFKLYKQSLNILPKDNKIYAFASDEHKMYHDNLDCISEAFPFSIDKSAFSGLSKALKGEDTVVISDGDSHCTFKTSKSVILVRKMEFKIPNFFAAIKGNPIFEAKVNRSEMIETLARCMGVSDDSRKIGVNLDFDEQTLCISASAWDNSKTLEESLYIENGKDISVTYNAQKLYACINNFSSEYIYIAPTGSTSCSFIKGDLEENEVTLIMPMML